MNFVRQFKSESEEDTRAVGRQLAEMLPRHATVLLIGDLGAGKTTLTKGIVEGRGIATAEDVSSPTFSLIHEYGDPAGVYHIDLYRLETIEEAGRIGLEELIDRPGTVLIEWGDRFPQLFPQDRFEIRFTILESERRLIQLYSGTS